MVKLNLTNLIPYEKFKLVVEDKSGTRHTRLKNTLTKVSTRYQDYLSKVPQGVEVSEVNWTAIKNKDFLHCYTGNTENIKDIKNEITKAQDTTWKDKCPYCTGNSKQGYDHYLPKEKFPEFAAMSNNLLPSCSTCNGRKSQAYFDNGLRTILNFYYDQLPSERLLFCTIKYEATTHDEAPVIKFELRKPAGFNNTLFKFVKRHHKQLKLLERFPGMASSEVVTRFREIQAHAVAPVASIKAELIGTAQRLGKQYGINSWQSALHYALADSNDFIARANRR